MKWLWSTKPQVDSQIVALQASGADVLLTAAITKYAAQAIRKTYDIGWKPTHFLSNVSASIKAVMQPAGPEKAVGIITAAYLKEPTDPQWENTSEYKDWLAWMKKYNSSANVADANAVYGYSVTQTMVAVLKACGNNLTRENIMKQAASIHNEKLPILLPGITVSTSPTDFAPDQTNAIGEVRRHHLEAVRRRALGLGQLTAYRKNLRGRPLSGRLGGVSLQGAPAISSIAICTTRPRARASATPNARKARSVSDCTRSRSRPDESGASGPINPSTRRPVSGAPRPIIRSARNSTRK